MTGNDPITAEDNATQEERVDDVDEAIAIACTDAGVSQRELFDIKQQREEESGIAVHKIEFETAYGDYDYAIAVEDGRIIDADYEVDEEWLDRLGGTPLDMNEAVHKQIALAWSPIMRRVYVVKRFAVHARPQVYEQLKQSEEKGIVRIIQVEQEETGFSVIEEYLNGELLSVWMKRTHGEEEIREVFLQMLRIVRALHHMTPPIIHRDLKPENFMVTDRGIVLFDFDVSRPYAKGEGVSTLVGTIGYAAPEQLGFEQSDPRSDIYSLGVILNELCCGHLPAVKQSSLYREVIRRCTKLDPADRYQSIEELREAFAPGSMRVPHKRGIVLLGYALISGILAVQTQPEQPAAAHEVVLMRIAFWIALLIPMALWAFSDVLWRLPLGRWKGRRVPLIPLSIALIFAEVFLFALISIVLDAFLA